MTQVRMLQTPDEMSAAERLLSRVWDSDAVQLDVATMCALAHTGNYVAGAFAESPDGGPDELVGCAIGFFAAPQERSLHSHIAGVEPRRAGGGIGTALKNHQRGWCLEQGVTSVTWTYDPLIARNAFFNLAKLGATVVCYLEDFYGPLDDGLNAGSPSDRLLVRWTLDQPVEATVAGVFDAADDQSQTGSGQFALAVGRDGSPELRSVEATAGSVLVQVPTDVERLRRDDPALAARWRLALREVLGSRLDADWQVTGFFRRDCYRLRRVS